MEEDNQTQTNQVPIGAKIISVIYYINSVVGLVAIIFLILNIIKATSENYPGYSRMPMLLITLILFIGFSIWFFLIAKGLWKGKNWARITAAVFAIIILVLYTAFAVLMSSIILGSISSGVQEIIGSVFIILIFIAIQAAIAGYLLFSKKLKESFIN